MKTDLMKLLKAQDIDIEIDRLIRSKKEYPELIDELKNKIEELERAVTDIEKLIKENPLKRRLIEEEITAERENLSKKEKRLLETKTNKEYTAVQHEIENARERIDQLETQDLELMTELDDLKPRGEKLREEYEAVKSANISQIDEIQTKYDSIESDIQKLERLSDRTLKDINTRGLSAYKRLRKGKSGLAVVTVDQNKLSCKGCFKQLPHQKVLEIRRSDKLIFCENCGRLLVWDSRDES